MSRRSVPGAPLSPNRRRSRRRLVKVAAAGTALTVNGMACGAIGEKLGFGDQIYENPPPPVDTGAISRNPPAPGLPTWDEVESGHPEGATNPPRPELWVTEDGTDCFKSWQPPTKPDPEVMRDGGRVIPDAGHAGAATAIACPDKASEVLKSWKLATSSQEPQAPGGGTGGGQ